MKNRLLILTMSICFLCASVFFAPTADAATEKLNEPTKEQIVQMYYGALKYNYTQTSVWTSGYSFTAPYAPGKLKQETLDNALNYLNFNRFVAGLSYDVKLNEEYNDLAQHGAVINKIFVSAGYGLTHEPQRIPEIADMSDDFYQKAYNASKTSNLGAGSLSMPEFIYGCMMDGHDNNIGIVGHRSWFLRPHVEEMGFGDVIGASAAVVMATGDFDVPYDYVAWPAKKMPMELFARDRFKREDGTWAYRYPFSIMLGDEYSEIYDERDITVTVKYKDKTYTLDATDKDMNGEYFAVATIPYGLQSKVIIFDIPEMMEDIFAEVESTDIDPSDRVDITISGPGLRKWDDAAEKYVDAPIHHTVDFFYIEKEGITGLAYPSLTQVKYTDKTKTAMYWEPIVGATSYKVEYKIGSGSWQTCPSAVEDKEVSGKMKKWVSMSGLEQGKTYYFRITAVRDNNPSRNATSSSISHKVPAATNQTPSTTPDSSQPGTTQPTTPSTCMHELATTKTTKATTTTDGKIDRYCYICGQFLDTYVIPKASNISLSFTSAEYTGKEISPTVSVKDSTGKELLRSNYSIFTPSGRTKSGTYTYTVTLTGNYSGSQTLTLTITPKSSTVTPAPSPTPNTGGGTTETPSVTVAAIKSVKLAKTSVVYTGKAQKVKVTVKDANGKVVSAANYTVTYKNNVKVGKATVTVKGKGNYAGTKTATFKIIPKAPVIKKPVAAKKAVTVKWNKVAKEVTGYEVMVATNKKFTAGKKVVTIKKAKTTSTKVTKLKTKKTYYVKVRTYKTVKGVKYYSKWSSIKTVKTK